jgi:Flp pilus assembly protein TadD
MTLNITVATERCIYQCADYRFSIRGRPIPDLDTNQKVAVLSRRRWHASVCYNGVAFTRSTHVGTWLAAQLAAINPDDPLERLYDGLQRADDWLKEAEDQRHTFCVGAINGTMPVIALVTNYELLDGPPAPHPRGALTVLEFKPTSRTTFVAGQPGSVARPFRQRLAALADGQDDVESVFIELVRANRSVAAVNTRVSRACFTTYVDRTGRIEGRPHGIDIRAESPLAGMDIAGPAGQTIKSNFSDHLKKQFPNGAVLRQFVGARSEPSEEFHRIQLIDNPKDPNAHVSYGNILCDVRADLKGAERAYRRALELDPAHTNALNNLANILRRRGELLEAEALYRKALINVPVDLNATMNLVRLLRQQQRPPDEIAAVISTGLVAHPKSAELHISAAENYLFAKEPSRALEHIRHARECGGLQVQVEALYAVALFMTGASRHDCIAACRTAVALDLSNAALMLNLAQLLFMDGRSVEASKLLRQSMAHGLDPSAAIEAHFYRLAHTDDDIGAILRDLHKAVEVGGRLDWNLLPTIQSVRAVRPALGEWLSAVHSALLEAPSLALERLLRSHPGR